MVSKVMLLSLFLYVDRLMCALICGTYQWSVCLTLLLVFSMQVFYYLGELNDSLSYALGAGPLFDVSEDTDYAHTLLGKKFSPQ